MPPPPGCLAAREILALNPSRALTGLQQCQNWGSSSLETHGVTPESEVPNCKMPSPRWEGHTVDSQIPRHRTTEGPIRSVKSQLRESPRWVAQRTPLRMLLAHPRPVLDAPASK